MEKIMSIDDALGTVCYKLKAIGKESAMQVKELTTLRKKNKEVLDENVYLSNELKRIKLLLKNKGINASRIEEIKPRIDGAALGYSTTFGNLSVDVSTSACNDCLIINYIKGNQILFHAYIKKDMYNIYFDVPMDPIDMRRPFLWKNIKNIYYIMREEGLTPVDVFDKYYEEEPEITE